MTYAQLAQLIEVSQPKQARAYALGHAWPRSEQLQKILRKTKGSVTMEAMHEKRLAFHRAERRVA